MADRETLLELTDSYLKSLISEISSSTGPDFDSFAPFGELGVDSFQVLKIIKRLEADFGALPKTLLFENYTVHDLSNWFVDKHEQTLSEKFTQQSGATDTQAGRSALRPVPGEAVADEKADPGRAAGEWEAAANTPVFIREREAHKHPELGRLIHTVFDHYKSEASVSRGTRIIAPYLFIGSERQGFFHCGRNKEIFLVYGYTGPEEYFPVLAGEAHDYCVRNELQLNLLIDEELASIGGVAFSSTPFGVMQRIVDVGNYTLQGGRMRRLRYQVSKFEKSGDCRTEEYQCGTSPDTDKNIVAVIDRWCESKSMVNPLIYIVREEILAGKLSAQHRLFLTYLDDVLQNVILISSMSSEENGYLMDLEFYPQDMPLGGLEFAIVRIIEILASEGCEILSLGGTYGCKLNSSANADPAVDGILDDLRKQNIFNDEGNLQFKNKFRPETKPIYLCRPADSANPDNVIDIIMMIADPANVTVPGQDEGTETDRFLQEAARTDQAPDQACAPNTEQHSGGAAPATDHASGWVIDGKDRTVILCDSGYNPLNIADEGVEVDLKTDSWAQLAMPRIEERMDALQADLQRPVDPEASLREVFPFGHFVLTTSGRTAEDAFFRAWPKKGVVLQNLLFPTTIFHQIDKGFTPRELPRPEVFELDSPELFKGNLDWDGLQRALEEYSRSISCVCIEVADNAAGGYPVSIRHLEAVKRLLSSYSVLLVMDGTRIVENARMSFEHERSGGEKTTWDLVREIFSYADVVLASLTKDFCVQKGGLIATDDSTLFGRVQEEVENEGSGLDVIDRKLLGLSLGNLQYIETKVQRRMDAVRRIWKTLKERGVPVVEPAGGHCVLIDVKQIPEFTGFEYPVASFLAWLYVNTGIRAAAHNAGMQKQTAINDLVRLALPVALEDGEIDDLIERLVYAFERKKDVPEIVPQNRTSDPYAEIHANFFLKQYHNASGRVIPRSTLASRQPEESDATGNVARSTPAADSNALWRAGYGSAVNRNTEMNEGEQACATENTGNRTGAALDIAVVGTAGRYPKAANLIELWDNLLDGRDCIDDTPEDRLKLRRRHGYTDKYRGGFIDDIDKFDSLFFNISPREAETLDPQERLFLEVAWEAIEDAGYYPEILVHEGAPRDFGVFVGAVWAMYQTVGAQESFSGNKTVANSFLWSIANRVSYNMNLSGPSITVDTACSASLTALHLACESIRRGECRGAIVGGVNLDVHQFKQEITVAGGLLSEEGVCRSFGKDGSGYVPGEGVGAVIVKPLEQAVEDGDTIHGVIKSIAINHGGRTSGYSVPNPRAQSDVISEALRKADIDARSIGYIEAHGTGTELGDPIEITGLNTVYERYGVEKQTCAIGSIKSNIGHLEAAAGIAGVCKVLLQMRHRSLVPSLHSSELNEFIDFEDSPFYVSQRVEDWPEKVVDGARFPLRAGVSSFGAGGSNAHVILERYEPLVSGDDAQPFQPHERVFPLSARNENQLHASALRLKRFVDVNLSREYPGLREDWFNTAYTLQVGRKSFDHRLAVIAATPDELSERLSCFLDGRQDDNVLVGHVDNTEAITKLLTRREKHEFISLLSQRRQRHELARLWIDGLVGDWQLLQDHKKGKRIPLPTYPFADKRHWIGDGSEPTRLLPAGMGLHPLIDANESTFERQIFRKTFNDKEFFIYDHLVSGIPTLPGVAYLDFARKAGEIAAGRKVSKIRNIVWVSPLTVENSIPTDALIELKPAGDTVKFEVFSEDEKGAKQLYAQGKLSYEDPESGEPEFVDIDSVKQRCSKVIDGGEAYPLFKSLGLDLGSSFQVLQDVYKNESEVLGVLQIPEARRDDFHDFILHPSLIDGSFQAAMGAQLKGEAGEMFVPYSLGEVEIFHPLTERCFSYVTESDSAAGASSNLSKMDVRIVDEEGRVLVKVRESIGVPLVSVHEKPDEQAGQVDPAPVATEDEDGFSRLNYSDVWEEAPLGEPGSYGETDTVVLFDSSTELRDLHEQRKRRGSAVGRLILVRPGEDFEDSGQDTYRINFASPEAYRKLFGVLDENGVLPDRICFRRPNHPAGAKSGCADEDLLHEDLAGDAYSMLFLCQALIGLKSVKKAQIIYLWHTGSDSIQPHNEAISGFAKTLQQEHPKFVCKTVKIQKDGVVPDEILDIAVNELASPSRDVAVACYADDVRYIRKSRRLDLDQTLTVSPSQFSGLKEQGVYLITGGAGGLGLIFAEHLVKHCRAKLVLTGRSDLSAEREAKLDEFRQSGSEVIYLKTDVSRYEDVECAVQAAKSEFGGINGIIHSAGVLRDSYISKKTPEEMEAVFAPKLYGTVNLDEATKNETLDFFVMFSSLAAVVGNAGQCDYSFANHFMDSFARWRERLREQQGRSGKTVSINWSLWADGGMQLDEQVEAFFKKNLGIKPLSSQVGIEAFSKSLVSEITQFSVLEGVQEKIEQAWGLGKQESSVASPSTDSSPSPGPEDRKDDDLATIVQDELSAIIMDFLKLDDDDIDLDAILLDLGFDSIGLTTFANTLNDKYDLDIAPPLFFEYPSIREIAKHLSGEYKDKVGRVHSVTDAAPNESKQSSKSAGPGKADSIEFSGINKGWNPESINKSQGAPSTAGDRFSVEHRFIDKPIAIVGMSGVMPQSDNLEEFWENLRDAEDNMVTLVPQDRWSWEVYYGDPLKEENKTKSKWGGFMRAVDKFDPLFWGISPREAEMMDPQQRIFLETVWGAVEDAGHKVSDLSGTKTGLFVGAATRDYIDLMAELGVELDGYSASGTSHAVLANRVSYLLNLHGPCAPLDTACSSSLVALHRAVESIHTGSSEMAIVGGVQVMLTPAGHISFGAAGMLADDGKCKTFDERADGYVRGEGSGAIFIKPLSMAEADGDHIYAVIKATAENHGGKATMLTAPNPNAQADLLVEAYEKARVDPASVGYIECHGTGTSLGDPIEIQAMKKAFSELYSRHSKLPAKTPHIGLTSAKTNIGHLETAAGIAGILKVLLSLKYKQIPALLHFEKLNPYIDISGTPFYMVDKTRPWNPIEDENGNQFPRRAGVSSFGFGGANVHIVLEEYPVSEDQLTSFDQGPQLFVLSAKGEDRLKAYARRMFDFIQKNNVKLDDVAYTSQVGRDPMEERLGVVADSMEDLTRKLQAYLEGRQGVEGVRSGRAEGRKKTVQIDAGTIERWLVDKDLDELLAAWVKGVDIDWRRMYGEVRPNRISMPTYPFARERCWFDSRKPSKVGSVSTEAIHPLLHRNTSTLNEQRYSCSFTGGEPFLSDYVRQDKNLIPSALYLEMSRAAISAATEAGKSPATFEMHDLTWLHSAVPSNGTQLNIALIERSAGKIEYEIYSINSYVEADGREVIHFQGNAIESDAFEAGHFDVSQLKGHMDREKLTAEHIYREFAEAGIDYGDNFQSISEVYRGRGQLLAYLNIDGVEPQNDLTLHPGIIEGAVQAAGLLAGVTRRPQPSSMASVKVFSPCAKSMYAWVRYSRRGATKDESVNVDIDVMDERGNGCVAIKSLVLNSDPQEGDTITSRTEFENILDHIADSDSGTENNEHRRKEMFEEILEDLY